MRLSASASPDYSASTVCREEAEHAMAHNKRLVPLLRRPVKFSALHPAIAAINALPFAESDDFDAGVSKLIEALDTDFEWLDQHTRLGSDRIFSQFPKDFVPH